MRQNPQVHKTHLGPCRNFPEMFMELSSLRELSAALECALEAIFCDPQYWDPASEWLNLVILSRKMWGNSTSTSMMSLMLMKWASDVPCSVAAEIAVGYRLPGRAEGDIFHGNQQSHLSSSPIISTKFFLDFPSFFIRDFAAPRNLAYTTWGSEAASVLHDSLPGDKEKSRQESALFLPLVPMFSLSTWPVLC